MLTEWTVLRLSAMKLRAIVIWTLATVVTASAASWDDVAKNVTTLEATGDKEGAARLLRQFVRDRDSDDHLAIAANHLGSLEQDLGRYREAEGMYRRAVRLCESRGGLELAQALNNLGSLYLEMGQPGRAEPIRRRSLTLRIEALGSERPEVALAYSNLAADLFALRRYPEAESLCWKALSIWQAAATGDSRAANTYNLLALMRSATKRYSEAFSLAQEALDLEQHASPPDPSRLIVYLETLASTEARAARPADAKITYERAFSIVNSMTAPSLRLRAGLLAGYASVLRKLGDNARARTAVREANTLKAEVRAANDIGDSVDVSAFSHREK
jgi:tetratricopeptide (TPR) repeat protein